MMMKLRISKMSLLMVLAILLSNILLPIAYALAADGIKTTLDIRYGNIAIGNDTVVGYSETGKLVETVDSDGYIITGSTTSNTITVADGTHNIILSGVSIDVNTTDSACAFSIQTGAVVNLSLSGANELISGINRAGLQVPSGASVTISGSGSLSAQGGGYGAGIGGGIGQSSGSITINGGTVTATGGEGGAGIGGGGRSAASNNDRNPGGAGGAGGSGGSIKINDGTVTATGGERGAGIGGGGGGVGGGGRPGGAGGAGGSGGNITISGGTVTATGGERGAGIGGGGGANGGYGNYDDGGNGGAAGSGGIITISTADITAIGKYSGAGIGSGGYGGGGGTSGYNKSGGERGSGSAGGVITISHATVEAQGGDYSAGIGGGAGGSGGEITITSTTVNALSSLHGAGIGGGGMNGSGGTIIINSSDVTVESINGAGIGGGSGGGGDIITIDGGDVTAQSQTGAAIGGGASGGSGEITITNATVDALSSSTGAGIGGGNGGSGDIITINGGGVTARSQSGAGIGGGASGGSGEITIANATIDALSSSTGAGIGGGNGGSGNIITINGGGVTARSQSGAGIGGGASGGSGGTITINSGDVTADSIYGAGIGGGAGNNGSNGVNTTTAGAGGAGGNGGSGGTITINGGQITATSTGGAGIGGGAGGNGGNGGNGTSGGNGGRGGNGGSGGTITINGGILTVPGENYVKINGGSGGSGGAGGSRTSSGVGGNGGSGGDGDVIITGGTIVPSGSGTNNGIGGAKGGNGGNGGGGTGLYETTPSGSAGAAGGLSSCVVTGGSVNASIGCTPTTGGETPVNVYYTVTRLSGADSAAVSVLSLLQGGETISYGIKDMRTDANGWLYLYLPAYEGSTTTTITAGGIPYNGYNGLIRATATFSSPNVLKINQTPPLTYKNPASKEFNYGETVSFTPDEIAVEGGLLREGTVTYTYSGTERGTGVIVTDSTTAPVNAGSYSLNATLPGNDYYHDAVAVKSFVINPKSIAGFTAEDISDKIYSGAAQTPAVIVKDGGTTLVNPRDFSVNYSGNTNVGTATADISGQNNYTGTLKKTFQIVPKEIALTLSAVPDAAMVGSDVALTATVSGAVDLPAGSVTFKYGDTLIAENVPIGDDGSYRATATWSSVPAGKYDLTATYNAAADDNYTCGSNGLISDFSILKYNQEGFAFADGTDYAIVDGVVNKTYGDSVFTLQTTNKLSIGEETFTVTSGSDVVTIDEITGSVTLLKSGTAVISVLSPSDATYNEASATLTISVAKAAQSGFSFADSTIAKTYGDADFTVSATGGQSIGGVTYAVTAGSDVASVDADSGEVTIHKSGTAVITATRAEDDRYLSATAELIITVAKASQSGFGFSGSTLARTYSPVSFTASATGGQSTGEVTYTVTAGSDVVAVDADSGEVTMLKAGTAVITATRATDDRYLEAAAELIITVTKAAQSGFGFTDSAMAKTYGDAPFTVAAAGGQSTAGVTYAVTAGSDVASVNMGSGVVTIHKSGTAVITATRATDDCYLPTTAQITITVAKAVQSGFGFAGSRIAKTYGDAAFTVSATGGQSTGVVTYAVTSGRGVISVNEETGRVAIQKAGTAVITATRAEDDRYNAATQTITIIVDKAQTIVTALPVAADIGVIGKLSTSALSGGAGSVPGHFSWADPDQIVSASGKYHAIFTPEDMGNYMPSTCDVQVNVMPVLVHSSTGIQFDLSQASVPSGVTSVNVSLAQIETDEGNISIDDITDLVNTDEEFSGIVIAVYDLALIDQSGQPISGFTGTITVRIPVPDGMSGDLRVFSFDTGTETMTDMNARLEDGWLVFETTHFSYYVIAQMTALSSPATVTTTTSADAGASTLLIVVLALAGVAVVGGLAVYLTIRKKRKA